MHRLFLAASHRTALVFAIGAGAVAYMACGSSSPPSSVDGEAGAAGARPDSTFEAGADDSSAASDGTDAFVARDTTADPAVEGGVDVATDAKVEGNPDPATDASDGGSCAHQPTDDLDNDGWTVAQGDCDDCNPLVNPNAVEFANALDDDCNGTIDDLPQPCDDNLAVDDADPQNGAKALELCRISSGPNRWGIVSAKWSLPDGSPAPATNNYHLGHGILPDFGPNVHVQMGNRFLGLSSGTARRPTDTGYQNVSGFDKGYTCGSPTGYPKLSPACPPGVLTGEPHDGVALEVTVSVPSNAFGFTFDTNFFTYEWPDFVCSTYNDYALAILLPIPMGQTDGNVLFDAVGTSMSVNSTFMQVCGCANGPPCQAGGKTFTCSLGDLGLIGTGFGKDATSFAQDHGSSSWVRTTAPVAPNSQFTLRLTVYDSADGILDSSAIFDNVRWIATPGTVVGTSRIPNPK